MIPTLSINHFSERSTFDTDGNRVSRRHDADLRKSSGGSGVALVNVCTESSAIAKLGAITSILSELAFLRDISDTAAYISLHNTQELSRTPIYPGNSCKCMLRNAPSGSMLNLIEVKEIVAQVTQALYSDSGSLLIALSNVYGTLVSVGSEFEEEVFLCLTPVLLTVKKLLLLSWFTDEILQDQTDLFFVWLGLSRKLLQLQTDVSGESQERIDFILTRLLELNLEQESVREIIEDLMGRPSVTCAVLCEIAALLEVLSDDSVCGRGWIHKYVHETVARFISSESLMRQTCPQLMGSTIRLFEKFGSPFLLRTFSVASLIVTVLADPEHCDPALDLLLSLPEFGPHEPTLGRFLTTLLSAECAGSDRARSISHLQSPNSPPRKSSSGVMIPKLVLSGVGSTTAAANDSETTGTRTLSWLSRIQNKCVGKLFLIILRIVFRKNRLTLNNEIVDQFPLLNGKPPILYHLFRYADHLVRLYEPAFIQDIVSFVSNEGCRVVSYLLFNRRDFEDCQLIGSGQFGSVFRTSSGTAVKVVRVASSAGERCTFHDALIECICQSLCVGDTFCLPLISCGQSMDGSSFFIESPLYSLTLAQFRRELPYGSSVVRLLIVFSQILSAVQHLHTTAGIIHYDLKMDNILVDMAGVEDSRETLVVPKIAIADFGEARIVDIHSDVPCTKNRGTECIKSPEMLSIAHRLRKDGAAYDRRREVGTTTASDIWSLGCLFFELMTGEYLFGNKMDGDWLEFYYRVADEGGDCKDILSEEDRIRLGDNHELVDFLHFMLVRDPTRRPSIDAVIRRFQKMYSRIVRLTPEQVYMLPTSIPGLLKIRKK